MYGLRTVLDAENSEVNTTKMSPSKSTAPREEQLNVGNISVEVNVLWGQGCSSNVHN